MHILRDENGNLIPHGADHDHEHSHDHDHEHEHHHHHDHDGDVHAHCGHCDPDGGSCKDETLALLTYMINHNKQHAAETDKMAKELEEKGLGDVAKQMREGVMNYEKGNMYLSLALSLYKSHLTEAHGGKEQ